jgi:hypothetical protein
LRSSFKKTVGFFEKFKKLRFFKEPSVIKNRRFLKEPKKTTFFSKNRRFFEQRRSALLFEEREALLFEALQKSKIIKSFKKTPFF